MSLEEHEQREIDLKTRMASISVTLAYYGKFMDEIMQIWTSLQEHPNVHKLQEEMQQNKCQLEGTHVASNTFPIQQRIANINDSKEIQKKIEELKKEEESLIERTYPLQDDALQLLQEVDENLEQF